MVQFRENISEFGYADANQVCFQGYFFMTITPGIQELRFYIVIIRENDLDYLLLNSDLEIEGFGQ